MDCSVVLNFKIPNCLCKKTRMMKVVVRYLSKSLLSLAYVLFEERSGGNIDEYCSVVINYPYIDIDEV